MAISNKSNVIKRSDKVTPLTQPEVDQNFQEIRNVIDDTTQLESEYHAYVISNDARVDTLTTNIGSVGDKVDELEFGDIAGTATAEQVPNLDASKITTGTFAETQLGKTAQQAGHVRAGNMQLLSGTTSVVPSSTDMFVSAGLRANTDRTIGRTGKGCGVESAGFVASKRNYSNRKIKHQGHRR